MHANLGYLRITVFCIFLGWHILAFLLLKRFSIVQFSFRLVFLLLMIEKKLSPKLDTKIRARSSLQPKEKRFLKKKCFY
jgi:hypothetical protein